MHPLLDVFKHKPLDLTESSIRLVQVLPDEGPLIQCQIRHSILSSDHTCLSYTWGSPSDDQLTILLNGKPFKVQRNLWEFLNVARTKYLKTWFWIDAICIIQDDANPEKSHQVQQMGNIYRNACLVIAWLGKAPNKYAELCLSLIEDKKTFDQDDIDYFETREVSTPSKSQIAM